MKPKRSVKQNISEAEYLLLKSRRSIGVAWRSVQEMRLILAKAAK